MFAPIFPPVIGGPATQSASLCKALVRCGYYPVVLTPGERFERKAPDGYLVYRYAWDYTHTALDRVIRWIVFPIYFLYVYIRERPQILHAHSVSVSAFVAGLFARLFGIPSIVKFAGDWVWETLSTPKIQAKDFKEIYRMSSFARFLRFIERFGVSLFTVVWVPSEFRRQNVKELLGHDRTVRRIPNSLLLPDGGFKMLSRGDVQVIVSANRFIPHKRISMIVRAFARLSTPLARLVLIGTGEEKEVDSVRQEVARLHLEDRVTFTGKIPSEEIYHYFKEATLYVSASLEEGFPNVFIEAMHFGLPIVSTDVGGCKEMVKEGKTGFLVDPMDEDALAKRMNELVTNPTLRNAFAKAAFEESKQYDLTVVVEQFIALYQELLRR